MDKIYHCMHCGEELKEEHIAPKECPDNKFLDKLAKSQWALFGSGGSLLYLCPECARITPILSQKQIDKFIEYIKKEKLLIERTKPKIVVENETTEEDINEGMMRVKVKIWLN